MGKAPSIHQTQPGSLQGCCSPEKFRDRVRKSPEDKRLRRSGIALFAASRFEMNISGSWPRLRIDGVVVLGSTETRYGLDHKGGVWHGACHPQLKISVIILRTA